MAGFLGFGTCFVSVEWFPDNLMLVQKKMSPSFTIISWAAATTRKFVNKTGFDLSFQKCLINWPN